MDADGCWCGIPASPGCVGATPARRVDTSLAPCDAAQATGGTHRHQEVYTVSKRFRCKQSPRAGHIVMPCAGQKTLDWKTVTLRNARDRPRRSKQQRLHGATRVLPPWHAENGGPGKGSPAPWALRSDQFGQFRLRLTSCLHAAPAAARSSTTGGRPHKAPPTAAMHLPLLLRCCLLPAPAHGHAPPRCPAQRKVQPPPLRPVQTNGPSHCVGTALAPILCGGCP